MNEERIVRVVTDVAAVDKAFDYLAPVGSDIGLGDRIRVDFHGRSVRGWVVDLDVPNEGRALKTIKKRAGYGPPAQLFDTLRWASTHYVTPLSRALAAASSERNVLALPNVPVKPPVEVSEEFASGVWTLAPNRDPLPLILSAYSATRNNEGTLLVLVPTEGWAERVTSRLVRRGLPAVTLAQDWPAARAGWPIVVGTRNACFAPSPALAGAVVIDADDEAFISEASPTWEAPRIVAERCRREGVPVWMTSPLPSPTLLAVASPHHSDDDLVGLWPHIEVVDRRHSDPRDGALSQESLRWVHRALHDGREGVRVAVILQRLGAGKLLACRQCGTLCRCAVCHEPEHEIDGALTCAAGHETREAFCRECGATRPRVVRSGVTTLARDVALQLGRKVVEVTASTTAIPEDATVVVGTEAVFRLVRHTGVVVFVDFDQYLLGHRERARRDAIYAVAKAGRMVGARRAGDGRVVVQTRRGDDDVISALTTVSFEEVSHREIETARVLELPPFRAMAEIGGAVGGPYAAALREAGVDVRESGAGWCVVAASHDELRDLLSRAPRPPGAMRLAIR